MSVYVQRRDLLKMNMDEARCYHRYMIKWAPAVIYASTRHKRGQSGDRRLLFQWSYQSQNIPELNATVEERKTDIRDITTDPSALAIAALWGGLRTKHGKKLTLWVSEKVTNFLVEIDSTVIKKGTLVTMPPWNTAYSTEERILTHGLGIYIQNGQIKLYRICNLIWLYGLVLGLLPHPRHVLLQEAQ